VKSRYSKPSYGLDKIARRESIAKTTVNHNLLVAMSHLSGEKTMLDKQKKFSTLLSILVLLGSSGLSVLFKQECGHTSFFMVRPINS
jgi:hypothetical protein